MKAWSLCALWSATTLALGLLPALAVYAADAPATAPAAASSAMAAPPSLDLLDRGELAAAAGNFDRAETLWKQALQAQPDSAVVKRRLAELPARRQAFPHEQATRQKRVQARLDYVAGITSFNHGDYGRAVSLLESANAAIPADNQIRQDLAEARRMEKAMTQGALKVSCGQKARVLLDGQPVGETPLVLEAVEVGSHRLELEAFGGRQSQAVEIKPMSRTEIALEVLGGRALVNCPAEATIFFDGRAMGQGPLELYNLPVGAHILEIRRPGRAPQSRQVVLRADEKTEVEFKPAP